jgi:hypothetical protein
MLHWLITITRLHAHTIVCCVLVGGTLSGIISQMFSLIQTERNKPLNSRLQKLILSWFTFVTVSVLTFFILAQASIPPAAIPNDWHFTKLKICFSEKYDVQHKNPGLWNDYCQPYLDAKIAYEIWDKTGLTPTEGK